MKAAGRKQLPLTDKLLLAVTACSCSAYADADAPPAPLCSTNAHPTDDASAALDTRPPAVSTNVVSKLRTPRSSVTNADDTAELLLAPRSTCALPLLPVTIVAAPLSTTFARAVADGVAVMVGVAVADTFGSHMRSSE